MSTLAYQRKLMDKRRKTERDQDLIPPPEDIQRRETCAMSLRRFIETYRVGFDRVDFQGVLFADQVEQIADVQSCVLDGDLFALAAMRGGGKSSILRAAVIWAISYGHRHFAVLVGATAQDANNHLEAIKAEMEEADLWGRDFPELAMCVRQIEGSSRRCQTHTVAGKRTNMEWSRTRIRTPMLTVDQSEGGWLADVAHGAQGYMVEVRSMDGSVRGLNRKGVRPDLVCIDDAETRESVKSTDRTREIRLKIDTDIGGLGSQSASMGIVYMGTIMTEEAVTAEFTDPSQRPAWRGKRYSYMVAQPTNMEMWEKYRKMRADADFAGPDAAREFYSENREAMDAGAVVAWPEGYDPAKYDSAIEKYFAEWADKKENGIEYVACELQNDPSMLRTDDDRHLTPRMVCSALSGIERHRIPSDAHVLAGFIDVHGLNSHLYYVLAAFSQRFRGYVIDYGIWPRRQTIGEAYDGTVDVCVMNALRDLEAELMGREYVTDSGTEMTPTVLVDSGWGQTQEVVYNFCRSARGRNFFPSKGETVGPRDFNRQGGKDLARGDNWRQMGKTSDSLKTMAYLFNANYWKRFSINRLLTPSGVDGSTGLFGSAPEVHSDFAEHLCAERAKTLVEKGTHNEYEIFELVPTRRNHYFDCFVGAHLVAAIRGCKLVGSTTTWRPRRPVRRAKNRT